MRVSFLLLIALLLTLTIATQAARHTRSPIAARQSLHDRTLIYSRTVAPQGWAIAEKADLSASITFTIVVEGSNAAALEERFWQVSDPDHPLYGHHMTNAEIEEMVTPSASDLADLYFTLSQHGIDRSSIVSHGDSFDITCNIASASALFSTTFYTFKHSESGLSTIRSFGDSSLPTTLARQVRLVLNVHTFPTIEQRLRMRDEKQAKQAAIRQRMIDAAAPSTPCWVPKAIAGIYGVPYPIKPLSTPHVNAGVIEWSEQSFSAKDLVNFSIDVGVPLAPVDAHHIVGNNSEFPYPGIEAELDIQWIEGVNPAFTPWFWLVTDPNQWMYSWTVQFLTAVDYPSVVSLSYGLPELMQCSAFHPSDCYGVSYREYIRIVDKQFMKIGLIGVSIITATQDRGVYANSLNAPQRFTPEYPGSSAFVTSVGATEFINPVFNLDNPPNACNSTRWSCISGGSDEESVSYAISEFLSSGGFSDVDMTPSYQTDAVNGYFNSGVTLPDQALWNRTGRGSPDVSAIGMNGYVVDGGMPTLVSGASMSTPIVAAIVALLQHDYYSIANKTLGFLNPLLYKAQASGAGLFKDIVLGDNCGTVKCKGQQDGFSATKGWDPVSGLGSPQYPNMKKYIQSLAHKVVARNAESSL